jgi:hypothetical protein
MACLKKLRSSIGKEIRQQSAINATLAPLPTANYPASNGTFLKI